MAQSGRRSEQWPAGSGGLRSAPPEACARLPHCKGLCPPAHQGRRADSPIQHTWGPAVRQPALGTRASENQPGEAPAQRPHSKHGVRHPDRSGGSGPWVGTAGQAGARRGEPGWARRPQGRRPLRGWQCGAGPRRRPQHSSPWALLASPWVRPCAWLPWEGELLARTTSKTGTRSGL